MPSLQLEYSSWFLLICMALAAGYAFLLYTKKNPWGKTINILLAVARFVVVGLILFLLLNPLYQQFVNTVEKPIVVLAIDNSESISNSLDSLQKSELLEKLGSLSASDELSKYDVEIKTLDGRHNELNNLTFDQKTTDINSLLREIETLYDGKNLASVVLVSDGNYNQGVSPAYFPYNFKVHGIGIGDTTVKSDVALKNVLFNKIAYQGNKFPVVAEVTNQGFEGSEARVTVSRRGKLEDSKIVKFGNDNGLTKVEFQIEAVENGLQHYRVEVGAGEEAILENNSKDIFIDIIDGKQKILILAAAPHPDIKALRSVIEINENYEVVTFIPGMNPWVQDKYDLAIVHQVSDRYNKLATYVERLQADEVPFFNISGQQTALGKMNQSDDNFEFKSIRNQRDQVGAALNTDFQKFKINPDHSAVFQEFPTLNVPYGDLTITTQASVLIYQRVGSISTDKPLLYVIDTDDGKAAYLLADGIWQWRQQEYALNENTDAFDEVFLKLTQYLSTKVDKRKFRVFMTKDQFYDNEPASFTTEIYNDSYERIYDKKVSLQVRDESGNTSEYSFIPSLKNPNFEINGLQPGIFAFEAQVDLDGKTETANGQFTVNRLQLELLDQQANFNLLRQITKNTDGQFYTIDQLAQLESDLAASNHKGILHSTEDFFALINLKWLFALLLILLSTEWTTRKYQGGY